MDTIQPGIYKHYKNKYYKVIGEATHSETEEKLVVYQCLYGDYGMWVRPKAMFTELVEVDGNQIPRFELIPEPDPEPTPPAKEINKEALDNYLALKGKL